MDRIDTCFFDLDGTLIDSSVGIKQAFRYTFEQARLPQPSEGQLNDFIGPPLEKTFSKYPDTEQLITLYRSYYQEKGMYQAKIYPEIIELLQALNARQIACYVATSKNQAIAREMVTEMGLSDYFKAVFGSTSSATNKAQVIANALAHSQAKPEHCVMIGDRMHDVLGAQVHHIETIGVLYGFGSQVELSEAGASVLITHPLALLERISNENR